MDFRILGPLEVIGSDGPLDLGQGKQRALLALLLLHANDALTVDRLVDDLWGEAPPPTAGKIVQNYVSRLRKSLDGDGTVLTTRGRGYELRVADGELDADRFERLFERARGELARGDSKTAADTLRSALALWRGTPLEEFAFESFAQPEIRRLEERRLAALEERIDADLALGRHADLVAEVEALVAEHPLRERLRAALMLALYRSGRQAEALQVYQDTRRALVDELGVEPGPALRQLQQAILEQDPSLGPARSSAPIPERATASWRRPVLVIGAVAALMVTAVVIAALTRGAGDQPTVATTKGNSVAAIDPVTNKVVLDIPVGRTPADITVGESAVWTLNADDQTITRYNLATKAIDTFGTGSTPIALAAGSGALWATTAGRGRAPTAYDAPQKEVDRLDADSTTVSAQVALPPEDEVGVVDAPPTGVVVGGDGIWALGPGGGVVRIDPETALVATKVPKLQAKALAYGRGALWALTQAGQVARVDPKRARVTLRIKPAASGLDDIAVGAGAVWAADGADGTLWRFDTDGARPVSRTIALEQGSSGVTVGTGTVWVINGLRGTLTRIDPRTNRVTATIPVGNTPSAVATGAGRVWVALRSGGPALHATQSARGITLLPASSCGRLAAVGAPDVLIASDFPLQGVTWHRALAGAVGFVLRQHKYRAGRFSVGYQSCDDSTPSSGGSDKGKCTANAKLLAENAKVVGVVGPLESGCAGTEIPILNRAASGPLALISPANSMNGLTRPDRFAFPPGAPRSLYPTRVRNYARVYPREDRQAAAHVVLARDLGLRRVFVLDDGEPYGQGMASHFRAEARLAGVGLSGAASWDLTGRGFRRLAERVARAHPDAVLLGGVLTASGGELLRALRAKLGRDIVLLAPDAFAPVWAVWDQAGTAARGMYITVGGTPNGRLAAKGRRFVQEFGGTQPRGVVGTYAVSSAAATEALLEAIARSDGTRASVTRQLLRTKLGDSVLGPISFDRNGDMRRPAVMLLRVVGREGASDVENYEGAKVERVIYPSGG